MATIDRRTARSGDGLGKARYAVRDDVDPVVADEPSTWGSARGAVISATEAARHFSDLISRVGYKGESFVIERGGKPMCILSPVTTRNCTGAELAALLAGLPHPADEFLAAVEAVTREQSTIGPSPWEP